MRPVQKFTDDYLAECKNFSYEEIVKYLDGFRTIAAAVSAANTKPDRSKLISVRIEEKLLDMFRKKAGGEGVKYQTKLKELMRSYVYETAAQEGRTS